MTDLETAISQASLWTLEARPLIVARGLVREAISSALEAGDGYAGLIAKAAEDVHEAIYSMREAALYRNEMRQPPQDCDEATWDTYEAFNEALNAAVPTVDAAIRAVENEG